MNRWLKIYFSGMCLLVIVVLVPFAVSSGDTSELYKFVHERAKNIEVYESDGRSEIVYIAYSEYPAKSVLTFIKDRLLSLGYEICSSSVNEWERFEQVRPEKSVQFHRQLVAKNGSSGKVFFSVLKYSTDSFINETPENEPLSVSIQIFFDDQLGPEYLIEQLGAKCS